MSGNPLVEMAANTASPKILTFLIDADRPLSIDEIAAGVGEQAGLVAAALKRLERHGNIVLDRDTRTASLA